MAHNFLQQQQQLFYGHRTGQTYVGRHLQLKTGCTSSLKLDEFYWSSFTVCMPLPINNEASELTVYFQSRPYLSMS